MKLILEIDTQCKDSVTDAIYILNSVANFGSTAAPEKVVEKKSTAASPAAGKSTGQVATVSSATTSRSEKKPPATAATESAPSTTTVSDAPTIEELTKVVQALTLSGNRAKLLEILKEYNAPKASAIPAELQREFVSKCQAVLDV